MLAPEEQSTNSFKHLASPEPKAKLVADIGNCQLLGETNDNKRILLYKHNQDSALMNEIGRLREESFRLVGEGTGQERDIDAYDPHYDHIVLWDNQEQEVVGAYRLKGCDQLDYTIEESRLTINTPLYTTSLFNYSPPAETILNQGLELGRSFVQAKYWGTRSLEYLWYGIAAYLRQHPQYKYLFGAVSMSNNLSKPALHLMVHYYQIFYGPKPPLNEELIHCRHPFTVDHSQLSQFEALFTGQNIKESFLTLKKQMRYLGFAVPVLYKQYAELTNPGGTQFLGFNIDPDFSDCIDGFVVVDIDQMTEQKRKRYQLVNHRI